MMKTPHISIPYSSIAMVGISLKLIEALLKSSKHHAGIKDSSGDWNNTQQMSMRNGMILVFLLVVNHFF